MLYLTRSVTAIVGRLLLVAISFVAVQDAGAAMPTDGDGPGGADAPKLLIQKHCIACHAPSEARVGPAWLAVSARYKNADEAQIQWLAEKVVLGGSGDWGVVPMVANPQISKEQAKEVVKWLIANDFTKTPQ